MKKTCFIRTLLICTSAFLISSCNTTIKILYGYRSPKNISEKTHQRLLRKLDAASDNAFMIDSTYLYLLNIQDTVHFRLQKKNHYQPIQALYFGKGRFPESWFINCYAGGFPNLHWDANNNFEVFPPLTAAPLDSILSFDSLCTVLEPQMVSAKLKTGATEPYTIVLFWNRVMFRQCKRLNRLVLSNLRKHPGSGRVIYVNNDKLYSQFAD